MTHDKAVELAHHAMVNSKSRAHGLVDAMVVLGLLDFGSGPEEQPAAKACLYTRLQQALTADYGEGPYRVEHIWRSMANANLDFIALK